jgi:hypothetical protein
MWVPHMGLPHAANEFLFMLSPAEWGLRTAAILQGGARTLSHRSGE